MFIKKIFHSTLILVAILILAAVLRLWQLGSTPPSPDWDEAALGYNAYSILMTGRDEYGEVLPIILRSFGDYKPALYTYISIPFIVLFGLETFAVRLPSALLGIITVLATYFLVMQLLKRRDIALIAALLLAISPWHIQFSRVAFETNLGLTLNVLGVLFFLKGLHNKWLLAVSALCFGLSIHAYQSEKVFVPLLVIGLAIIFWRELFKIQRKALLFAFTIGLLVILPVVASLLTDTNTLGRAKGVSVFSEQSVEFDKNAQKLLYDRQTNDKVGLVLNNRRVFHLKKMTENYLSHWNLNWLFVKGDISRHHAPGMGLLYFWELPFILIGIYSLIFHRYLSSSKKLIVLWFLLAPLPAAFTTGVPHAVRTLNFLPMFQIISAMGLVSSFLYLRSKSIPIIPNQKIIQQVFKKLALIGVLGIMLVSFMYYLNQYFVQLNYFDSQHWQYGYHQAVQKTEEREAQYSKIVVSNDGYLDQSYIFYLYYLQYSPQQYQQELEISENNRNFGKYEFRPINWEEDKELRNVFFVGMPGELPEDLEDREVITFIDGTPAIVVVGR